MIKFNNKITKEDFIEYNIFHMNNSKVMKNTSLGIRFVFPIGFLMFGLLSGKELDISFWIIMLLGSLIVYFMIPRFMDRSVRKRIEKMIAEGDNGDMFTEKEYEFTDDGINMKSASSTGSYKWKSITKINESEKHIYLFVSTVQAIIIPKDILLSQIDLDEFRKYVYEKTKKQVS